VYYVAQIVEPEPSDSPATASVVGEVSEDAKVLSATRGCGRPPIHIGFAIRASVEVIMVRAVEPHVNRCRGGSQDTGQTGASHPRTSAGQIGGVHQDVLHALCRSPPARLKSFNLSHAGDDL
jgi:hypothetical protein